MAKDCSSADPKDVDLQSMVSDFCFVAKTEENEIDKLMEIANTIFKAAQSRERAETLGVQIGNLKQFRRLLKRDFTQMASRHCQTEEDLFLARQEMEGLSQRQARISKQREELKLSLVSYFLSEILYCKKDLQEVTALYQEHDWANLDTYLMRKKANEDKALRSWEILRGSENECHDSEPWSLTEVMMVMYGFELEKAEKEEGVLARFEEELLPFALENLKDLTSKNLVDEALGQKKAKLDVLLLTINAITNSSENDSEMCEAWEVMTEWLYHIEWEIFFLAVDLLLLASSRNQVAALELQESLRLKLDELKQRKGGRVLVVVYRIMTFLKGKMLNRSAIMEDQDRIVEYKDEKEKNLLSDINQILVNQLYEMILRLMSVLDTKIGLSCLNLSDKEALIGSVEIVERCDEEWRAIRAKIDEATRKG